MSLNLDARIISIRHFAIVVKFAIFMRCTLAVVTLYLPIDGLLVEGVEVVVAAREGFGAEEAAVRGERGGVRGFDDAVLAAVDEFFLGAGVAAPEDEYQVLPTVGEGADGLVGEGFPALVAVRAGVVRAYCEDAIE